MKREKFTQIAMLVVLPMFAYADYTDGNVKSAMFASFAFGFILCDCLNDFIQSRKNATK